MIDTVEIKKLKGHLCIEIGTILNMTTQLEEPRTRIIITEDTEQFINHFADVRIESDLKKIYKINNIEFTIGMYYTTEEVNKIDDVSNLDVKQFNNK